jgi:modified peptide precursor CbpA
MSATSTKPTPKKEAVLKADLPIIAVRKSCDAEGTGLSHYVLMDKQVAK